MSEAQPDDDVTYDHQDSYVDMVARRHINEHLVDAPMDFNVEGLRVGGLFANLKKSDLVLDIGCSSGAFILKAAEVTKTESHIVGLEPDERAYDLFSFNEDTSRFTFMHGVGEDIPLPDNSVRLTTAHNVIFRAQDAAKMLNEIKRVTEPGGMAAISTNARYHAFWRHTFERAVARVVADMTSEPIEPPPIPAHGFYLEDLRGILELSGGFEVVGHIVQLCAARITKERVIDFMKPISSSVNRTSLSFNKRGVWRDVVEEIVEPFVTNNIKYWAVIHKKKEEDYAPYFADLVHRGMLVAKIVK